MKEKFIKEVIKEAKKAYEKNEVPVGAIIVKNNKIIAKGHNLKEKNNDCTKHAEMIVISKASKKLKNWRLVGCDIYITLEPCPMCASAIKQARINHIYYLDSKNNTYESNIINKILEQDHLNKKTKITRLNNDYKFNLEFKKVIKKENVPRGTLEKATKIFPGK